MLRWRRWQTGRERQDTSCYHGLPGTFWLGWSIRFLTNPIRCYSEPIRGSHSAIRPIRNALHSAAMAQCVAAQRCVLCQWSSMTFTIAS